MNANLELEWDSADIGGFESQEESLADKELDSQIRSTEEELQKDVK